MVTCRVQQTDSKDPMIFSPANNTEYLNVAAYLEAFWGYIWQATCHHYVPPHEEWRAPKHGGLKEFVDHVINALEGRSSLQLNASEVL